MIVFLVCLIDGGRIGVGNWMMGGVVEKKFLVKGNSYMLSCEELVVLVGWVLGGVFIGIVGGEFVVLRRVVL
ncbi:hypothetical protein [Bacillus pumilus]|uniref:hypothetical protein n=1 Tax=Bacillus pumilus TaxID=1408 RepID=UPI0011A6A68B|nr:hypothetical protein [Bacillus pumilus]